MNPVLALARKIFDRYKKMKLARLGNEITWQRMPAGFEMKVDPAQWLDQRMLFGVYEPWLRVLIRGVVQAGEGCLDIGAHKGYFTLSMAQQTGSQGVVHAFDADPRVFAVLQENVARNGFDWVHCHALALGEEAGSIRYSLTNKMGNSSRFAPPLVREDLREEIDVPMRPLDEVMETQGAFEAETPFSFIKLDAEGSEPYIMRGMTRTLDIFKPILFMEFNFHALEMAGTTAEDFAASLRGQGYELYRVEWDRDFLLRGRLTLIPLAWDFTRKDTVDVAVVHQDSPYAGRLRRWIA